MARLIKAVGDRIVCSPLDPETISAGGIILGTIGGKERPMAVVLSVGDTVTCKDIIPGAVIVWRRDLAVEFKLDGLPIASITTDDVVGIIDEGLDVEVVYNARKSTARDKTRKFA